MLKISAGQANALRSVALDEYIARLIAHLRRVFPDRSNELGDAGLRMLIDAGMNKTKAYGFVSELEICKYIDLMMLYGADFDAKPPWESVFKKANDRRAFERAFDEAYDALLNESRG